MAQACYFYLMVEFSSGDLLLSLQALRRMARVAGVPGVRMRASTLRWAAGPTLHWHTGIYVAHLKY